jgi:hypothetical protein
MICKAIKIARAWLYKDSIIGQRARFEVKAHKGWLGPCSCWFILNNGLAARPAPPLDFSLLER